jgi:hypothetical protein
LWLCLSLPQYSTHPLSKSEQEMLLTH